MAIAAGIGSIVSGVTGFAQAMYQQRVAEMNASVAQWNAERATRVAGIDAQEKDFLETRALLGEQVAAQAASGVSLAGKSQIATRATAMLLGRRDANNIIEEGRMQRHGHLMEAANFKAEAKAAGISGISSLIGGFAEGASAVFKGMSSSKLGGAKASSAQTKYPLRPVIKPQPFKPVVSTLKSPLIQKKAGGVTQSSFQPMKRRFGH
jgi:hypothetical protein